MSAPILMVAEDARAPAFHPLSDTRPVFELRAGIFSIRRRLESHFPERRPCALAREPVAAAAAAASGIPTGWGDVPRSEDALLVNGRLLASERTAAGLLALKRGESAVCGGRPCAARLDAKQLEDCRATGATWPEEFLAALPSREVEGDWVEHPWDFVSKSPQWLALDARTFPLGQIDGTLEEGAVLRSPERIYVGEGARIEACAYLDASSGPIVLSRDVLVQSHTRIEGPAWVGPGSRLLGGRIGKGSSIGPECRIAGELEETVVQGYSNKRHQGFVGHSYLGEWVNLGALTTTSDLKNNYGTVRMWEEGRMQETGLIKLGSLVGDHAKTGIGTLLGTGTVVGVMSNVFRVTPPRYVPSFRWLGEGGDAPHRWDKAGPLLHVVLGRRNVKASPEYAALFQHLAAQAGAV